MVDTSMEFIHILKETRRKGIQQDKVSEEYTPENYITNQFEIMIKHLHEN